MASIGQIQRIQTIKIATASSLHRTDAKLNEKYIINMIDVT